VLIEADVSEEWDSRSNWEELAARAVRTAVVHSRHATLAERDCEISVKFTSDDEVHALNAEWRGKDKPTNVLSFPMAEEDELDRAPMLGDIVLAHGVCATEAADRQVSIETHATHLVVHGTLHLLGYDHETSDADAELMEETERKALAAIGIADPYSLTGVHS